MLVLLIDGVGHVREYDVPQLYPTIYMPMPNPPVPFEGEREDTPPATFRRAEFTKTAEESYPPVYRLKP